MGRSRSLSGSTLRYVRLETQEVTVGQLPGLRFGLVGLEQDGQVYERWVTYVAFDSDLLYIQVAFYRPDAINTFRSDEELQTFLPYLDLIVAGLRLPLPVLETAVTSVQALRSLDILWSYGVPTNPVGELAQGQSVVVTGVSPNQRYWRIECPDATARSCWIAAGPDATVPNP